MPNPNETSDCPTVEIHRYPNRRFYDTSHSRYVSLADIQELIRNGSRVCITDSKTKQDISAKVLAQIIIERDPPKLQAFPVELLHQLVRTNQEMVLDFVDTYFNQAMLAFFESRRAFEGYLRDVLGIREPFLLHYGWADVLKQFAAVPTSEIGSRQGVLSDENSSNTPLQDTREAAALRATVDELAVQIKTLRQELATLQLKDSDVS